jgi:hypothetical protein
MKQSSRGRITFLALLLAACAAPIDQRLYEEATAKEATDGLPATISQYQAIVRDHPGTDGANKAQIRLMEFRQARQQEALQQLTEAEGKPEAEAMAIYRRIVEQYSDTEVAKAAAERVARLESARRAVVFSDAQYEEVSQGMMEAQEAVGEALLKGTHPTGTYRYTDDPTVSLSSDQKQVNTEFVVHWEGFSETPYRTVYRITWSKMNSYLEVNRVDVTYDDAVFKIDPQFLKRFEQELTTLFHSRPILTQ